ncbi:LacI family DNA-binding transcriptional regulator [Angustibacter sp. McL0619]|uniref:LacI family DNA-binding transcriptional regulator n=1 Tax=Angustibacter sp. McL0619 TaxID=3415676 RepID=UPI003CEEC1B4
MTTISDVARAAGVSVATVSRALRGLDRVSPQTRDRVLRAAKSLDYMPSPTASSLASGKTHVVAVVVPYVTRWYFAHLISGASQVLRDKGFHVLLLDVRDEGPNRATLLDSRMLFKRVDGVLILSLRLQQPERELLQRLQMPVVTVGVPDQDWPCVRIDDIATTSIATEHLIRLGHRRIGYVGGDSVPAMNFPTPADRAKGFRDTMGRHGLDVDPGSFVMGDWSARSGLDAGRELLSRADRPTAVVAASDELALGVMAAARELALSVPRDVSVVGIDDHELAELHGLTTIAQPVDEQGRMATRLLLSTVAGLPTGHEVATVPVTLVERRSTAAPPRP